MLEVVSVPFLKAKKHCQFPFFNYTLQEVSFFIFF